MLKLNEKTTIIIILAFMVAAILASNIYLIISAGWEIGLIYIICLVIYLTFKLRTWIGSKQDYDSFNYFLIIGVILFFSTVLGIMMLNEDGYLIFGRLLTAILFGPFLIYGIMDYIKGIKKRKKDALAREWDQKEMEQNRKRRQIKEDKRKREEEYERIVKQRIEKRREFLKGKKKFERILIIYGGLIKLESIYKESNDNYEISISLKKRIPEILDLPFTNSFFYTKKGDFPFKSVELVPCNEYSINDFFKRWRYFFIDFFETKKVLPSKIKYISYIDDNMWIQFDSLAFFYLDHYWYFDLFFTPPKYSLFKNKTPNQYYSSYEYTRSEFTMDSLTHNNLVMAQFILSKSKIEFQDLLKKKVDNMDEDVYFIYNSEDFNRFSVAFNKKWGW